MITIVGLQLGAIIAFAIVTETVFQWPGMGLLFIQSVYFADIPVMAAYLCLIALVFVIINLVVDLLYYAVDPRLRIERAPPRPLKALASMKPSDYIVRWHDEFTAIRRDLHAHPELGFEEHRTARVVQERLAALGIEHYTGIGKTGIVAVIHGRGDSDGTQRGPARNRHDRPARPMRRLARHADRGSDGGVDAAGSLPAAPRAERRRPFERSRACCPAQLIKQGLDRATELATRSPVAGIMVSSAPVLAFGAPFRKSNENHSSLGPQIVKFRSRMSLVRAVSPRVPAPPRGKLALVNPFYVRYRSVRHRRARQGSRPMDGREAREIA